MNLSFTNGFFLHIILSMSPEVRSGALEGLGALSLNTPTSSVALVGGLAHRPEGISIELRLFGKIHTYLGATWDPKAILEEL